MIQLTSELLAIRTRSIVNHDRIDLEKDKNYSQKNNDKQTKEDTVLSIVNYLKRLIVK